MTTSSNILGPSSMYKVKIWSLDSNRNNPDYVIWYRNCQMESKRQTKSKWKIESLIPLGYLISIETFYSWFITVVPKLFHIMTPKLTQIMPLNPHLIRFCPGDHHLIRILLSMFFFTESLWNQNNNSFCHYFMYGWNYIENNLFLFLLGTPRNTLWKPPVYNIL